MLQIDLWKRVLIILTCAAGLWLALPNAFYGPVEQHNDAVKAISVPVLAVHLSDPSTREAFRHHSYVEPGAVDVVKGLGAKGYLVALDKAAAL